MNEEGRNHWSSIMEFIRTFWPMLVGLVLVTMFLIQSDAKADNAVSRIVTIEEALKGPPTLAERLARIEARQDTAKESLDRIETRFAEQDKLLEQRRDKMNGL